MRGHFIGGSRKFNRRWQSGEEGRYIERNNYFYTGDKVELQLINNDIYGVRSSWRTTIDGTVYSPYSSSSPACAFQLLGRYEYPGKLAGDWYEVKDTINIPFVTPGTTYTNYYNTYGGIKITVDIAVPDVVKSNIRQHIGSAPAFYISAALTTIDGQLINDGLYFYKPGTTTMMKQAYSSSQGVRLAGNSYGYKSDGYPQVLSEAVTGDSYMPAYPLTDGKAAFYVDISKSGSWSNSHGAFAPVVMGITFDVKDVSINIGETVVYDGGNVKVPYSIEYEWVSRTDWDALTLYTG